MNEQLYYKSQLKDAPEPKTKNDILKLIAIVSMLADHIGYGLFPDIIFLRIIGRAAFPIFAFNMTVGYTNTKDLGKYMFRLLVFALVSQIPFGIFVQGSLNVMFTLLAGLCCIYCIDRKKYILLSLLFAIGAVVPMDYGIYGIAIIVLFYIYRNNPKAIVVSQTTLTFAYCSIFNSPVQIFCLVSLFFILKKWKFRIIVNKYFFYIFYPVHMFIILLIARAF